MFMGVVPSQVSPREHGSGYLSPQTAGLFQGLKRGGGGGGGGGGGREFDSRIAHFFGACIKVLLHGQRHTHSEL